MGKKPQAFMKELDVNFVSLVDKGANKQKFAIYKSEDGEAEAPTTDTENDKVKKNYGECYHTPSYGSSFSGAMEAIDTQEALYESQNKLDEGFYILKMVMKGVLDDDSMTNKSSGLKKAIEEFKSYTVELFNGLDIAKASELISSLGGEDMGKETEINKAKGVAQGGVSANTQPAAQNRVSSDTKVSGVSKKGRDAMKKEALESGLEKAKAAFEDAVLKGEEAAEETAFAEVERIEKSLTDLEKAVGDRTEGAPASGEDTVSKNGDEATDAETNNAETGDTSGAVAKEDASTETTETTETPNTTEAEANTDVAKNTTVGTTNPDTMSTDEVNGGVANVNEKTGDLQPHSFEAFQKTMAVSLSGVVESMSKLIKEEVGKLKGEMETKIAKSDKKTDALSRMGGLSNSYSADYEESEEIKKSRADKEDLQKSEDEVFAGVTSLNGLKRETTK